MRTLLLMRGAPGCGKSTWIEQHNLKKYTLCPDDLRILCNSYSLNVDGSESIARNQDVEQETWKILFDLLEFRMSRGQFTVIDATCSKTRDIQQYKTLADQYRYRIYIVDFTNIPLEQCLKQNKMRPQEKWVPEEGIKNIYSRFKTQQIPGGVKIIQPNEFDTLLDEPIDLSEYKKLVFIGDIHGCYDTLMQYFKDGIDKDTNYIFIGDYLDRGNQNVETIKWLHTIYDCPNVCLLEGNHEVHISSYGRSVPSTSREFEHKTRNQLINGNYTEKEARMFYRKVRQMSHITYKGIEILACHGGIPHLNTNLLYVPSYDFIHGVGEYKDYTTNAETWMRETKENQYLIHGHRNTDGDDMRMADRVFNLEGQVEFGGQLRILELNENLEWNEIYLDDCQPVNEDLITEERKVDTVEEAITYLRNNKSVEEKKLGNGISSFNFTRQAFLKKNWNKQTILARGLFIDTDNNKIMARSYEKFFKIDEVYATQMNSLKDRLQFPVQAFVKENGFLAIVSYDYKNDDLFIASKSTNQGDYVEYIKKQLEPYREKLLEHFRTSYKNKGIPHSYVFECIDIENDPHIIKYDKSKIVLLDIIFNELQFGCVNNYNLLKEEANWLGCPVKELAYTFKTWEEFKSFVREAQREDYKYNDEYIEGFVFKDSTGFMTKLKTDFYNEWKKLRGVADQTLSCGYITKTGMLYNSLENLFYGYCRELFNKDRDNETKKYPFKTDIISLREKFLNR